MILKSDHLFYFSEGISSVFDSQVLALLDAIQEKKIFTKIYLFVGVCNNKQRDEINKRKIPKEIELILFKLYPNYPLFNFIIRKNLRKVIKNTKVNLENVIFHARGELMAWHLSKSLDIQYRKNIIPDIRGAGVEEIVEFSSIGIIKKKLKIYNYNKALKYLDNFNQLSAVSFFLKEILVSKYEIDPDDIHIVPCLSGPGFLFNHVQRARTRNELNLRDEDILVVFSSGGTAEWQNNDILNILAEKKLKILNLAKREIEHKNIINKFVSYSEVPLYLNAADLAIIWREKSIVNKVASPVKFSEYVCCGLPVIANDSVDMIKEYIVKNSSGIVVNNLNDIKLDSLIKLKQKDRRLISETGLSNFGIDKIINKYTQIYSTINSL